MGPILEIHLLGTFRLIHNNAPVTALNAPRLQKLLAYLLLNRRAPQTRQHLAFLFWPDSTEKQAYTNLRKAILALRRALPDADDCLHINKQTVGWRQEFPCTLDVAEFENALAEAAQSSLPAQKCDQLEQAVAGCRGDLLPGFYDDWLLEARERLRQQYEGALGALIELLEGARDYAAAIQYAQTLLRHDPLHETAYRRLMRLYALSGNRAAALRTYHTCVTTLQRELGAPPGAATRELHDQLVKVDTSSQPAVNAPAVLPLVGRQQEWQALQSLWRDAAKGQPSFTLISGEAGIGKTRLAEELATWADRQGITTVGVRCFPAEGELPYAPIVEWLRAVPIQQRFTDVDDTWLGEVARLLPELQIQRPDLPPPTPIAEGWQRHHLFTALAHVVLDGNQPCLLLLNDAQWADQETLEWVSFLFRFAPQGRFLILATIRSEEVTSQHRFTAFKRQWQQMGYLVELPLSPLTPAETTALAQNVANTQLTAQQASQLHRQTEGNPLFIVETLRSTSPSLMPPKIQSVIETRLTQLSPPTRRLLDVAAVMGRSFEFELWRQTGDVDEETAINALDELWQRRIIREQGEAYDFSHSKIREIAYAALGEAKRRSFHSRVAQLLEASLSNDDQETIALLAHHYANANKAEKAAHFLTRAGDNAFDLHAFDVAIGFYNSALNVLTETGDYEAASRTLMKIGLGHHAAFQFQAAQTAYSKGFELRQKGMAQPTNDLPPLPSKRLRLTARKPLSFDPARGHDFGSVNIINQLFSGLVELSADNNILPAVAYSWALLDGGRKYIFHLRQDAVWSDGAPVTAQDFLCAWQRTLDPGRPSPAADLLCDIKGVAAFRNSQRSDPSLLGLFVPDARTLVIELEKPTPYFISLLAKTYTCPIPKHIVEVYGERWAEPANLVTNGPFQLASVDDHSMRIIRFASYFGEPSGNVKNVELIWETDWREKLRLYETDQIDILSLWDLPPHEMKRVRQNKANDYLTGPWLQNTFISLNARRPPFDDVRVRRARI